MTIRPPAAAPASPSPAELRRAVAGIVAYNWDDELTDLREQVRSQGAVPAGHVFLHLLTADNWLTGRRRTVEQVLRAAQPHGGRGACPYTRPAPTALLYRHIADRIAAGHTPARGLLSLIPYFDPDVEAWMRDAVDRGMDRGNWTGWFVDEVEHHLRGMPQPAAEEIQRTAADAAPVVYHG